MSEPISTIKAREIRIQKLIRRNPDVKRLYDQVIGQRIQIASLEKQLAAKSTKSRMTKSD